MLDVKNITPAIMVKNEEYWIHFVLRYVLERFPQVILLDTGSTDDTLKYASQTVSTIGGNLIIIEDDYGSDASKIGNGRNVLRERVETEWMFLIDGDELWTPPQLDAMLSSDIGPGIKVVMAGSHNIEDVNGILHFRDNDIANKDILFRPDVRWSRLDYPFEGYGLSNDLPMELVQYVPADLVFCYHMRHTLRSSDNSGAFFRDEKYGYYPYEAGHSVMDLDLLGAPTIGLNNPYIV